MGDDLNFDITPVQIPVQIGGNKYVLKEADGEAERQYENARTSSYRTNDDGRIIGYGNLADTETLLISLCLYDEKNTRVPINVVRSWPARVTRKLYEKAKEISELDLPEDDAEIEALERRLEKAKELKAQRKNG